MLGGHSLLHAKHWDAHAVGKEFHLGAHPVRVAGMKVYRTTEDTCILETPVMWGSSMHVDVQVYVKVGPLRVVVPVSVSDIQFKVLARVSLEPLVDTIPCIGGASVSLLEVPHFDMKLRLFNGPDMMALPGIKDAVRAIIKVC